MNRYLITIASPECPGWLVYPRLEQVVPDVAIMETFFQGQDYRLPLKERIPVGAPRQTIKTELANWMSDRNQCAPDDLLVVYVTGHGGIDRSNKHFLITSDSQENNSETRIETGYLAGLLFNQDSPGPQSVLLLLDVCYAGQGGSDLLSNLGNFKATAQDGAGFHIIVSAGPFTEASDGAFVRAFRATMHDRAFLDRGGVEYLSPYDLTIAINDQLTKIPAQIQESSYSTLAAGRQTAMFIRNPQFTRDLDGKLLADQAHWQTKARGGDDPYSPDCFFSGRCQALRELTDWLRQPQSDGKARVVTSAPGSGKSALLGRLVLTASSSVIHLLPNDPADASEQVPLATDQKIVGINATGETLLSLTKTLSQRLGFPTETVDELMNSLSQQTAPVGIVIDSLDEATEAALIVDQLLYPLAGHPAVRLIVGSRRFGERIPLGDRAKELNLDADAYFSTADIADYVFERLTRRQMPTVYTPPEQHPDARRLADYIAGEANQSFLYARLVSRWFESADHPPDTSRTGWEKQITLPADVPAVFGHDLDRFNKADRQRIVELLVPLAYAKGKGLPQKTIWYTVASALADRTYRNYDIEEVKNQVSYYLIQDSENGEIVFRLFHKALADYLRYLTRDQSIEQRFAQALRTMSGSDWQGLIHEPYLRSYLPVHAAIGGQLDEWMRDVNFLVAVSPMALIPHLPWLQDAESRRTANAYREAVKTGLDNVARLTTSDLRWQAVRFGATRLADQLMVFRHEQPTFARWGVWLPAASGYELTLNEENSITMTTGTDLEGNPIVVCGYESGVVRVWNLNDGTILMDYKPSLNKTGSHGIAENADFIQVQPIDNDVLLIVVTWWSGTVRVLSLRGGLELSKTDIAAKSDSDLRDIEVIDRNGQKILLTCTYSQGVSCYSLPNLEPINSEIGVAGNQTSALSVMTHKGQSVLVMGCYSKDFGSFFRFWTHIEFREVVNMTLVWQSEPVEKYSLPISSIQVVSFRSTNWIVTVKYLCGPTLFDPVTNRALSLDKRFYLGDSIEGYEADDALYLIGLNGGELRILKLTPTPENSPHPFDVIIHPNKYSMSALLCRIVTLRGRTTLVSWGNSQKITKLHVWDLEKLLAPFDTSNIWQLSPDDPFSKMTAQQDRIITVSSRFQVRALTSVGDRQWETSVESKVVAMSFVKRYGIDWVALCLLNKIVFINPDTGQQADFSILIDGDTVDMTIHTVENQPIAFVGMHPLSKKHCRNVVRAWNVLTGEEVNTLLINKDHKRFGEVKVDGNEQPWAIQRRDSHRESLLSKSSLNCVRVLAYKNTIAVVMSSIASSEIRAIDFINHSEIDAWSTINIGVPTVEMFLVNNEPYVLTGSISGELTVRNLDCKETTAIGKLPGFATISALSHHKIAATTFLLVGTQQGHISFWTHTLQKLHQIDAESSIRSLAIVGDNQLAICTDQGIMVVDVDWARIAQGVVPA